MLPVGQTPLRRENVLLSLSEPRRLDITCCDIQAAVLGDSDAGLAPN
jgi:hypothetical protein